MISSIVFYVLSGCAVASVIIAILTAIYSYLHFGKLVRVYVLFIYLLSFSATVVSAKVEPSIYSYLAGIDLLISVIYLMEFRVYRINAQLNSIAQSIIDVLIAETGMDEGEVKKKLVPKIKQQMKANKFKDFSEF